MCFTDLTSDNHCGWGGAPIILAAQAARNLKIEKLVLLYAKSALQIHMNPIQQHYAYVKLATSIVANANADGDLADTKC
jgi:hypothetical protein